MLTHEENELLTRVEGEAPMGQLMRRHWIPALLSEELPEAGGKPVRIRLLGENLVAFRNTDGQVGVLDERCAHRKASLVYGRNEDGGLRCLYHGWTFGVDGTVIDMPSEPPGSPLKEKVRQRAYPVQECGGFVWVYMGPQEAMPPFERPPFSQDEATRTSIVKIIVPCNWAQIEEGQIDSAHSSTLHSSDMVPDRIDSAAATDTRWLRPSTDRAPRFRTQRTDYGFRYVALRRPIKNAATHEYARVTVYVAPFLSLIPPNTSYNVASLIVPIDDEHSSFHFIAFGDPASTPDRDTWRAFNGAQVGPDLEADYRCKRHIGNDFLQDRDAMREGNFTGIRGIPNQDIAMWTTMGRIADRTQEILGASDVAVVEFRRLMVEAARAMRENGVALGADASRIPRTRIASWQGIVPKEVDWRTLGATQEELAALGSTAVAA